MADEDAFVRFTTISLRRSERAAFKQRCADHPENPSMSVRAAELIRADTAAWRDGRDFLQESKAAEKQPKPREAKNGEPLSLLKALASGNLTAADVLKIAILAEVPTEQVLKLVERVNGGSDVHSNC